jgi:hypothetical protein
MKGIVSIVLSQSRMRSYAISKFLLMFVTTWWFEKSSNTMTSVSKMFATTPNIEICPSWPSSRGIEVGNITVNYIIYLINSYAYNSEVEYVSCLVRLHPIWYILRTVKHVFHKIRNHSFQLFWLINRRHYLLMLGK